LTAYKRCVHSVPTELHALLHEDRIGMLDKDFFDSSVETSFCVFLCEVLFCRKHAPKVDATNCQCIPGDERASSAREESRSWPVRMASALLSMQGRHPQIKPLTSFKGMGVASHHLSTQAQGFAGFKLTS